MADTISAILSTSPDPLERALALTLSHVTPAHVAQASLDPHPRVQAAVARYNALHAAPENHEGFKLTHGQVNDANGPARMTYFGVTPEHGLGAVEHDFNRYSHAQFKHTNHFAVGTLGYVRYTGDPAQGQVVVHEVHAPWHQSPAMRGVATGSWVNKIFGTKHDLDQVAATGRDQISDIAHHGVQRIFQGQDPHQFIHDSFQRYAQAKGSTVSYHHRPFEPLRKDVGFVTFPKMGVDRVPTKPMVVQPGSIGHQSKYLAQHPFTAYPSTTTRFIRETQKGTAMMGNAERPTKPVPPDRRYLRGYVVPGGIHDVVGTSGHEAQHTVFADLGMRYGSEFRRNVATKLLGQLSPGEQMTLNQMMEPSNYDTYQDPEEGITCCVNYLTDPKWREHVHSTLGLSSLKARSLHNSVKRSFKKLRSHAALLTHEDIIGGQPPVQSNVKPITWTPIR